MIKNKKGIEEKQIKLEEKLNAKYSDEIQRIKAQLKITEDPEELFSIKMSVENLRDTL